MQLVLPPIEEEVKRLFSTGWYLRTFEVDPSHSAVNELQISSTRFPGFQIGRVFGRHGPAQPSTDLPGPQILQELLNRKDLDAVVRAPPGLCANYDAAL